MASPGIWPLRASPRHGPSSSRSPFTGLIRLSQQLHHALGAPVPSASPAGLAAHRRLRDIGSVTARLPGLNGNKNVNLHGKPVPGVPAKALLTPNVSCRHHAHLVGVRRPHLREASELASCGPPLPSGRGRRVDTTRHHSSGACASSCREGGSTGCFV